MSRYVPATFQPTVRPDWGGILSYLPESEKANILDALFKYPAVKCDSKFWLETIKPDLDLQYDAFIKSCQAKSRAVRDRWSKTDTETDIDMYNNSNSNGIDIYNTCITDGIVTEREREEEEEREEEKEEESKREKEEEKEQKKESVPKIEFQKYGEFKKVKLTLEEYNKLKDNYGRLLDPAIQVLDDYIASSNKRYLSHYAVMKKGGWVWNEIHKRDNECPVARKMLDPETNSFI